jgi:hypothetical protein
MHYSFVPIVKVEYKTWTIYPLPRPNNLSLACLHLSLYISFLLFGHFFLRKKIKIIINVQILFNKKEIYNDKYKHTRDRLFGLSFTRVAFNIVAASLAATCR